MTEYELDLSYRLSRHPHWKWVRGMLGVEMDSTTVFTGTLNYKRYRGEKNFSKFCPSISDPYTTHLIWEETKKFDLPDYSLVRAYDQKIYKGGFKRGANKAVLLYSSSSEGHVAVRMWLWCASRRSEH